MGGVFYRRKKSSLLISVVINVLSVILMGLIEMYSIWLVLRLLAGVTGGSDLCLNLKHYYGLLSHSVFNTLVRLFI